MPCKAISARLERAEGESAPAPEGSLPFIELGIGMAQSLATGARPTKSPLRFPRAQVAWLQKTADHLPMPHGAARQSLTPKIWRPRRPERSRNTAAASSRTLRRVGWLFHHGERGQRHEVLWRLFRFHFDGFLMHFEQALLDRRRFDKVLIGLF